MSVLQNKIDFVVLFSAEKANVNGDPLNGNRPRTDYEGYGEMSDVCVKRKIRNRMQDMGEPVFVQMAEKATDGFDSLSDRAVKCIGNVKDKDEYAAKACELWLDVRSFGQVFAFKSAGDASCGVRGPVSVHQAVSASPVEVRSIQITKSVNGEPAKKGGRSADTMGQKHFVQFGLYKIKGSVNVQLAEKTGFTDDDAEIVKECLRTLFVNDASAARPDGSMEVVKLFWWQHNCKDGQYSSAAVHRSVHVELKDGVTFPTCVDDYNITVDELPGLVLEEIAGV